MASTQSITTAQQLLDAPGLGRCELVRGEVVMMTPAGFEHGRIALQMGGLLSEFVRKQRLGMVTGAETGFLIAQDPDTVRAPDVAFVRADRIPSDPVTGFFPGAPDLAVEVLSPGDRAGELLEKVEDWLGAGCQALWVVDPAAQTVSVYTTSHPLAVYHAADELTGGERLAGFRVSVAEIFAR